MEWNVYVEDFNAREIVVYNVFDHWRFHEDVLELLKKDLTRDEFSEALRRDVFYYFGSKCEWEIVITSFPTYITKKELDRWRASDDEYSKYYCDINLATEIKVDVYQQLMLNWNAFVDYTYSFKK